MQMPQLVNGGLWPTPAEFDDYGIRLTRVLAQRLVSTRADLQSLEKQMFECPSEPALRDFIAQRLVERSVVRIICRTAFVKDRAP